MKENHKLCRLASSYFGVKKSSSYESGICVKSGCCCLQFHSTAVAYSFFVVAAASIAFLIGRERERERNVD